jgi:hypothetical protein
MLTKNRESNYRDWYWKRDFSGIGKFFVRCIWCQKVWESNSYIY